MINDRYKIIRKVGEGRSKVFFCEDSLRKDMEFAIKILPSAAGNEEKKSFRDEYYLLKKLNHPNIINVFDFGTISSIDEEDREFEISAGSKFFTLEYFEGSELFYSPEIKDESRLEIIICQISSVLYYIHQSAFIYYDLKSENILVKSVNNKPVVKFIDFGLTLQVTEISGAGARGSAEYIAPEILRNDKIDHRVDLYSLGILLYKIIYGRFPFKVKHEPLKDSPANNQLSIYKAHLDEEFEFPESVFSNKIINISKRLVSKEVEQRYFTSIGILEELNPLIIKNYKNDWTRIPVFTGRSDFLSVISTYIEKEHRGEVLIVKGSEGAGKSTLLNELNYKYEDSILVNDELNNEKYLWQFLLRKILYKDNIISILDNETIQKGKEILKGISQNLIEDLKALLIKISSVDTFVLLIDDFHLLSDFDLEIFLQLIPVLQVNKIKIVIAEDPGIENKSEKINNLQIINLNPFTEAQVAEFVNKSFASFFPGNEIRKAIVIYSDLLPGSIEIFLKDLIVLNLLKFLTDGPVMNVGHDFDLILKSSQEEIYQLRINDLEKESNDIISLLAMFNINPDVQTISVLTGKTKEGIYLLLERLSEANIIHRNSVLNNPQFTSHGIKEYIYSRIGNKRQAHLKLSDVIIEKLPAFDRNELARHLEIAGEYEKTYEVLMEEVEKADKATALSYKKGLLQHLIGIPQNSNNHRNVEIELANCLFQLGELNASIILINELLQRPRSLEEELSLKILKGKELIGLQSLEEGKNILELILDKITEDEKRNEILAEIAEAEYEMGRYGDTEKIIDLVLENPACSAEIKGKLFRIKGLVELFEKNNPQATTEYFIKSQECYKQINQLSKVAVMENNLGNIYNIISERIKAEEHWNKAIEINNSIGNLLYKAGILLNNGIYYLEACGYEKAINQYLESQTIFQTLGDKNNLGITLSNLGEAYLITCEYENAIDSLNKAVNIFHELNNYKEEGEAVFLLGKLFFEFGEMNKLNDNISEIMRIIKFEPSPKMDTNLTYLKILERILQTETIGDTIKLLDLQDKYRSYSDQYTFNDIQIILFKTYFTHQKYQEAFSALNSSEYLNICENNVFLDASRNFLLGKLSEVSTIDGLEPELRYFEEAFEKINTISITELTWKIVYELYKVFKKRGNFTLMNKYKNYTKQTILHIATQIKSDELRDYYLDRSGRKEVLIELNSEQK